MADNSLLPISGGTETFANNEISGVKYPRVKVVWGVAGSQVDASASNPLPVVQTGNLTVLPGNTANTTPWLVKQHDGTTAAKVAPASTAPVATDPALIVSLSPNSAGLDADTIAGEYETVAASQTAQVLGATGATGDYIMGLLVIPATTTPGVVTLLDNATSIPVFVGGASSVSNLVPFFIPLGMRSVSGAWKVTTGANVSVIGIGNFT